MSFKKSIVASSIAMLIAATSASAETIKFETNVKANADTLVVFHGKGNASVDFKAADKKSKGQLSKALKAAQFKGSYGSFTTILAPSNLNYDRVIVAGLGDLEKLDQAKLTKLGGNLSAKLQKDNINTVKIATDKLSDNFKKSEAAALLAHGINLRSYKFETYHSKKRKAKTYLIDADNGNQAETAYAPLANIEKGVFFARDLTNETATEMTPSDFAAEAKKLEKLGVEVKVLLPEEIKKLNMGALEAVGRGSQDGSRLIVAHYKGSDDAPIALVGKGITFDSGGYNIKTGSSISRMKSDMAGAAAVLSTVKVMALNKEKVNVVAVMGMAANMVSEFSYAPGDVLRTAEGKTVEITNTDAEGRLVLSDAMWYARKFYEPQMMVDLATLTGSKVRAVGNDYAALFSDDDAMVKSLTYAGKQVNENLWRLPLDYKEKLKTDIADLRNTGTGGPGASTAASFLQHFAGDTRWAHLDIAGNALAGSAKGEVPMGGTGYGVRLLSNWLMNK